MTIQIQLTPEQTKSITASDTLAEEQIAAAAKATLSPDQFVFFAAFDGTNNDANNKGNATPTNVDALWRQYKDSVLTPGANFGGKYYAGLGTKGTLTGSSWNPTQVTAQANITANNAYKDFCKQAIEWLDLDRTHHQTSSITAALTSFSRGDAAAAIFSQLLYENGLVDTDGTVLIAPGQIAISAGVIFDPVTTGYSGNLAFAPNATNIVDVRAMNEYRYSFETTGYDAQSSSVTTINMIGNHADIGGSYDHGIAALALQGATAFFINSGIKDFGAVQPDRVFKSEEVVVHSEGDILIFPTYQSFTDSPADLDPANRHNNDGQLVAPATEQVINGSTVKVMTLFNGDVLKISTPGGTGTERVEVDSQVRNPNAPNSYLTVKTITNYTGLSGSGSGAVITDKVIDTPDHYFGIESIAATIYTKNSDIHEIDIALHDPTTTLSVQGDSGVDISTDTINVKILGTSNDDPLTLSGATTATGNFTWEDGNNEKYSFAPTKSGSSAGSVGALTITGGLLDSHQIVISDFDLNAAQTSAGYLGIKLGKEKLAVESGTSRIANPFVTGNYSPSDVSQAVSGALQTITIFASAISDKAQSFVLNVASASADFLGINKGDGYIPFSDGPITLTIPAGQDSVSVALVNTSDGTKPIDAQLKATLAGSDASSASNVLDITFAGSGTASTQPSTSNNTINGDLNPKQFVDEQGNTYYKYDVLGNIITDGSAAPGRADQLKGSTGNDLIKAGEGNNSIDVTQGGNDTVTAGTGDDTISAGAGNDSIDAGDGHNLINANAGGQGGNDTIVGGIGNDSITAGNGNNVISGHGGQDIIWVGNGDNHVFGKEALDLDTALAGDASGPATGDKGSLIAVGNGDNTVVGGTGNDFITAGSGNNLIILGAGNDTFLGGSTVASLPSADWTVVVQDHQIVITGADVTAANAYAVPAGWDDQQYAKDVNGVAFGTGNDIIFAGSGNSFIKTSNGNNYVDAGLGNTRVEAGGGNDTIFGGDGNGVLLAGGGDDYIDAEGGNHYITGGQGDNTIYGGYGNDTIFAGEDGNNWYNIQNGNNYVDGGAGNSLIFGSGGNDTLIAGDGDSTVSGGLGKEYIEGGDGNSILYSNSQGDGRGNATLVAGDGNTTMYGGHGQDVIYGGDGIDVIHGGDGTQEIHSGDGGTAESATTITVGAGNTTVYGGDGYLKVTGGSGNDTLIAGDGDTTLTGGSGTEIMHAGAGDDLLTAGSGSDTLFGGQGNATLQGGSGQTTFHIDADVGDVLIAPSKPSNILEFGAGISVADLVVTGTLDSDGNAVLEIDLPDGGTVAIQGGMGGTLQHFSFTDSGQTYGFKDFLKATNSFSSDTAGPDGDLIFSATDGDLLVGTDAGNDTLVSYGADSTLVGGAGNETFVVHDSSDVVQAQAGGMNTIQTSVSYTAAANVQNLVGTGTDNLVLAATDGFDQTITANAGNDTLIGAMGNDTLIGGAGLDTFVLGTNTGAATAVQNAGVGGIVQLAPGLRLDQLSATRLDDDLLLRVNGSASSMRLQDYFTSAQPWTIEDSAGSLATPLEVLSITNEDFATQASQRWNAFYAQTVQTIRQDYLQAGWTLQSDGSYSRQILPYQFNGEASVYSTTTSTTLVPYDANGLNTQLATTSLQTSNGSTYYSFTKPVWTAQSESVQEVITQTDDSMVTAAQAETSVTQSAAAMNVTWTPYNGYTNTDSWISYYGFWTNSNGKNFLLTIQNTKVTTVTDGFGTVTGIVSVQDPSNVSQQGASNGLPDTVQGVVQYQNEIDPIQEIQLTSGDQTVSANSNTMVVGGTGNSTIYGAGLAMVSQGNNDIRNATIAYGGAGNDTMVGGEVLVGGSGNELMIGGTTMVAGTGNDQIYAGTGDATIKIDATCAGVDLLGGAGNSTAFLNAFYAEQGIDNWKNRYIYPDMYSLVESGIWTREQLLQELKHWNHGNPASIESVLANGDAKYLAPLPVLAQMPGMDIQAGALYSTLGTPVIQFAANDFEALAPYLSSLPTHRVVFGAGISADQISLSWGTANASMSGMRGGESLHTTLNISWGGSGMVQVLIPHFDDPIGSGITEFDFADGSIISLADLIAKAPPAPTFDPQLQSYEFEPGNGEQDLDYTFRKVDFSGLSASQVAISRDGSDLILSADGSADFVCLTGWYDNPAEYTKFVASFADGSQWDASYLTQQGLIQDGSSGNQTVYGLSGYANTLIAGSNDTLVGGDSNSLNTYVFNSGSGVVHIQDSTGNGTIVFGAGITADQITLELGSLELHVGNQGDTIHIDNFNPQDALGSSGVSTFEFADGSALTLDQLLQRGFDIHGTSGDEVLTGTNVTDRIYAGTGNDTLIGGKGNDLLIAGSGADVFQFSAGDGNDTIDESAKVGVNSRVDSIVFDSSVNASSIAFDHQGDDLVVRDGIVGDAITVKNPEEIGSIRFANGSHDVYQVNGTNSATITQYDQNGQVQLVLQESFDGLGNMTTMKYGTSGDLLGSMQQSIDAQGDTRIVSMDVNGVALSDTWTNVDGSHGDDTFDADAGSSAGNTYQSDGSHSNYIDDGQGIRTTWNYGSDGSYLGYVTKLQDGPDATETTSYDADNNLISDVYFWTGEDGGYERRVTLSDGTYTGTYFDPQGTYGYFGGTILYTYTGDDQGNYREIDYDANGNLLGTGVRTTDDLSSFSITTLFNPAGIKVSDHSINWSDWTIRSDTFNADGSSSGRIDNSDGSYSTYTTDTNGNETTLNFDYIGNKLSDSWTQANGTSGSDTFNADGTSSGQINNSDGSYSTYTTDTNGYKTTVNFDANNNFLTEVILWTSEDGSYSREVVFPDGTFTGTYLDPQGADGYFSGVIQYSYSGDPNNYRESDYDANGNLLGTAIQTLDNLNSRSFTTLFDPTGTKISDSWYNGPDGSRGTDTFNADGSSSGRIDNSDGSYSTYTIDANGNKTTLNFDVIGNQLSDSWTNVDGSHGDDTFDAVAGSSAGNTYQLDGSHSNYIDDGQGNRTTWNYGSDGSYLGYVSKFEDGSITTDTKNYDADNNLVSDVNLWTGEDGSYERKVTLSDGTYTGAYVVELGGYAYFSGTVLHSYAGDDQGNYRESDYDANGNLLGSFIQTTDNLNNRSFTTLFNPAGTKISDTWYDGSDSEKWSNGTDTFNADGSVHAYVQYILADGSTRTTDTITLADGSTQQTWSNSDGSTGVTNVNGVTGEVTGSNATAGAGYSYTFDNTQNIGGVSGVTESQITYIYSDGSAYWTDTLRQTSGAYEELWYKSDGSAGETDRAVDGSENNVVYSVDQLVQAMASFAPQAAAYAALATSANDPTIHLPLLAASH
ncbi:calcium-binding protein [Rhodoferax sp. GW822-FHT02A01]|uniref:beta strand repeat-containing protein n=1 Tax=Rhodoferax sp. GW822-FHT02A01 TaxID=3141537 RepID=UPI00315DC16D